MSNPDMTVEPQGQEKFLNELIQSGVNAQAAAQVEPDKPSADSLTAEIEKLRKDLEDTKHRYSESSKEGIRLAKVREELQAKIEEYNTFDPFINALKTDKTFLDHVGSYYNPDEDINSMQDAHQPSIDMATIRDEVTNIVQKTMEELENRKKVESAQEKANNMINSYLKDHPEFTKEDVMEAIQSATKRDWTIDEVMRIAGKSKETPSQQQQAPRQPNVADLFRPAPSLATQPSAAKKQQNPAEAIISGLLNYEKSHTLHQT